MKIWSFCWFFVLGIFSSVDKITCGFYGMILPDKTQPFVRRGRKAAGLLGEDGRAAEG